MIAGSSSHARTRQAPRARGGLSWPLVAASGRRLDRCTRSSCARMASCTPTRSPRGRASARRRRPGRRRARNETRAAGRSRRTSRSPQLPPKRSLTWRRGWLPGRARSGRSTATESDWTRYIEPSLGRKKISKVDSRDVLTLIAKLRSLRREGGKEGLGRVDGVWRRHLPSHDPPVRETLGLHDERSLLDALVRRPPAAASAGGLRRSGSAASRDRALDPCRDTDLPQRRRRDGLLGPAGLGACRVDLGGHRPR